MSFGILGPPTPGVRPAVEQERAMIGQRLRDEIVHAQRDALGRLPSEVEL